MNEMFSICNIYDKNVLIMIFVIKIFTCDDGKQRLLYVFAEHQFLSD